MANNVNNDGTATTPLNRVEYVVTRTHEGPMGSLSQGSRVHVDADDPRLKGMIEAGMIEAVADDETGEATSRRAAAKRATGTGDSTAKNG